MEWGPGLLKPVLRLVNRRNLMDPRAEAQVALEAWNLNAWVAQSSKATLPFAMCFFSLPRVRVKKAGRKVY